MFLESNKINAPIFGFLLHIFGGVGVSIYISRKQMMERLCRDVQYLIYHETIVTNSNKKPTHPNEKDTKNKETNPINIGLIIYSFFFFPFCCAQVKSKIIEDGEDEEIYETELAQLFSEEEEVINPNCTTFTTN